ncbi:hypothetical protein QBC32DRAFT_318782 [Pseudoneurospora amorphoporcata]|uniref:Uncharacterized protein n=1 Tax=Pseudoneurospora amorphoporcata TaxID=241081 RepID=A0AAN6SBF4_9PEZI|nr:hypothetical protein QBC32DRAFT_318782 [Pseudoneurospora amorphoporcata]
MNGMRKVPPGDYPLIRSSLELVERRLENMMEVFVPLLARINNTLPDAKGLEQKLDAMEKGLASNEEDASGSFQLFFLEFKSLMANLVELEKMFVAHGIPSYSSPSLSAEDKLNSMEDMIVSEMEKMILHQEEDTRPEVQSKFKPVMEKLGLLEKMYRAAMASRNVNQ